MNVLVACEESQAVTIELRKLGVNAFSCDTQECSGGHPEWHVMQDVLPLLDGNCEFKTMDGKKHEVSQQWDMIIAHPPCTDLAVSGAAWFEAKRKSGVQRNAIVFFMKFMLADCEKICVENPVNIISGEYIKKYYPDLYEKYNLPIKPTQSVQPYMFGHPEQKKTCLWLKNLAPLSETENVKEYMLTLPKSKRERLHYLAPGPDRAKERSKTFPGIAKAMSEQWVEFLESEAKHE